MARRSLMVASLLVTLGALLPVTSASAAWTPYFNVAKATDQSHVVSPRVAVAPDGAAVFLWNRSGALQTRVRNPDGSLGSPQAITPPDTVGGPGDGWKLAVNSQGNAFYVWIDLGDFYTDPAGGDYYIRGRVRHANGTLGPVQTLATARGDSSLGRVQVGTDDAGRAVFSWVRRLPDGTRIVQARSRSAAGTLSPTINVGSASEPQMAVASDGRAFFSWRSRSGAVLARVMGTAGSLTSIQQISASGFDPQVVTGGGGALYLWVNPGDDQTQARVMARQRLPGGSLTSPQLIAQGGTLFLSTQGNVAMAPDGTAAFCWVRAGSGAEGRIRLSSGTLGPIENIGGDVCQVGIDTSGDAVFAGSVNLGEKRRIFARTQPAGGALSSLRLLSPAGYNAYLGGVAVNGTGDAAVVWQQGFRGFAIQGAFGP